jgi:hypothetical protein
MSPRFRTKEPSIPGVGICAALAALLALFISHQAFHFRPLTTDENSYFFQAQNFLEGQLARPVPPAASAFHHPMIIIHKEAGWLSRYPPAHPLWLMPGALIGFPLTMSFLGAGLGVILLAQCGRKLGISPLIPALALLLCPFYLFMYGTLLSHTSAFLSTTDMLLCYLHWQQTGNTRFALLSGVCWGLLFLNRTYTATLIALPFGLDAVLRFFFSKPRDWKGTALFAGTSLVFALLFKGYNKLAVGSSRATTFLFYDPSEGLGFGPRHTSGLIIEHSLRRGLENMEANLIQLDQWLFGFRGGLIVILLLAGIGWHKRWSPLLLLAPLSLWAGYVYFWYPGIEHFQVVYSFEALPFLLLAAGLGLHRLLEKFPRGQTVISILILLTLLPFFYRFSAQKVASFSERNAPQALLADTLRFLPDQSLAILDEMPADLVHENMLNLKGLDSDPLVVRGNGIHNGSLAYLFPDRFLYEISGTPPRAVPYRINQDEPIRIPVHRLHLQTGQNEQDPSGRTVRTARPENQPGFVVYGRYFTLPPGNWEFRIPVTVQAVSADTPLLLEIAADHGREILVKDHLSGTHTEQTILLPFQNQFTIEIEPRVRYEGSGTVLIHDPILHKC